MPLVVLMLIIVGAFAVSLLIGYIGWKIEAPSRGYKRVVNERQKLHDKFFAIINSNNWDDDSEQSDR